MLWKSAVSATTVVNFLICSSSFSFVLVVFLSLMALLIAILSLVSQPYIQVRFAPHRQPLFEIRAVAADGLRETMSSFSRCDRTSDSVGRVPARRRRDQDRAALRRSSPEV